MRITSIAAVDNEGPNSMRAVLRETLLSRGLKVDVHVAFVTMAGIAALRSVLLRVAERGIIRIVTGLYQGFTEPQALSALLEMQASTNGRLSVRLARERSFHRKLYLVRGQRCGSLFVGSSNLTADGLASGGEYNLHITLPESSAELKKLTQMFDEYWQRDSLSFSFSKAFVATYRRLRRATPTSLISRGRLNKLLASTRSETDRGVAPDSTGYWRDYVTGVSSAKTAAMVHEETNWDKKGYLWFTPSRTHGFKIGDRVLLFDHVGRTKWAYLIVITAVTTLSRRTADGRHFVAFIKDKKAKRRKIGKALWRSFSTLGVSIGPRASHSRRRLSPSQWKRFLKVF